MAKSERIQQIDQIHRLIDATLADVALAFDSGSYQRGRIVGQLSAAKGYLAILESEVNYLERKERVYDSL